MDGLGLLVVMAFIILILVIVDRQSCPPEGCAREGFTAGKDPYWDSYASKPQTSLPTQPTLNMPVVGPAAAGLTKKKEPTGYTGVSDLPSAPVANLGEVNSLPYQDPRFEKVSTQMLRQLKVDMDGFSTNEAPHLKDRSDPAIRLPLTRFQGDYQRIKDELAVVDRTPGFQSQLAVEDLNDMAANLRFLQRTYRLYAANEMVPAPQGGLSKVGVEPIEEGFATADPNAGCSTTAISFSNCEILNNTTKFLNAVLTAYARKVMNIQTTNFFTLDSSTQERIGSQPDIQVASNTLPYFESIEQAQEYMKNKDQYIIKIGLGEVNRSVIKAYLDKRYEWMNPTGSMSEEDYQKIILETYSLSLINQLNGLDFLNTKYSLNITRDVIMNTPQMSPAPSRMPPIDPNIVSRHFLYQKYFANTTTTSGSTSTRPVRPSVTGLGTSSTTVNTPPSYPNDPADQPISVTELNILRQKLAVEILRLQASGTTDPVLAARVNVFKKIQTAVEDIATQVDNGAMRPQDIPIRKRDYEKFLPALGDQSAGIAGLLSNTGYPSLSSLFNAYDRGDVTGPELTQNLFQHYADILLQGLSYKLDISYTSPNEVAARQAEATKAAADLANAAWPNPTVGNQIFAGLSGAFQTTHPMTFDGARGAFDAYTRQLDMQGFQGELELGSQGLPDGQYRRQSVMPNSAGAAHFDWKARAEAICDNVKKMGMNPADFGCQPNPQGSAQNTDFSWRGYAKMVCNRLKTVLDPGAPEQVGCPPDSWRGWRT